MIQWHLREEASGSRRKRRLLLYFGYLALRAQGRNTQQNLRSCVTSVASFHERSEWNGVSFYEEEGPRPETTRTGAFLTHAAGSDPENGV